MKIKKPVVGDVVIYDARPCIVTGIGDGKRGIVNLIMLIGFYDGEGNVCEIDHFSWVKYPEWKYPEQTDEMIEVDDD